MGYAARSRGVDSAGGVEVSVWGWAVVALCCPLVFVWGYLTGPVLAFVWRQLSTINREDIES